MRLRILALTSGCLLFGCQVSGPSHVPTSTVLQDNFHDLESEYAPFRTQALTANYVERKVRHWITQNNGEAMRREIEFARLKHPTLVQNLMSSHAFCNQALTFAEINTFRSANQDFDAYLNSFSCAPTSVVGEFQLNTDTQGVLDQSCPSVAMAAQGNFVVTFEDCYRGGLGVGVEPGFARLYNAAGNPVGLEFPVDEGITANRKHLRVGSDATGNFQVVWAAEGPLTESTDIYLRRYTAQGQDLGAAVRVNTFTTGVQSNPAIATAANGQFVVVWMSLGQDGSATGIYGQRFDASGQAIGDEIEIPTTTLGVQAEPDVAIDDQGRFVVVWSTSGTPDGYAIYAQRFHANGQRDGLEFQVSTFPIATNQAFPSVGSDKDGNLQFAWQRYLMSDYQVETRFYPVGDVASAVTVVARANGGPAPVLGKSRNGRSVITWMGDTSISAQRYLANGNPEGSPIEVALNNGHRADVSLDPNGNFVIVWGVGASYAKRFNAHGHVL